MFDECVLELWPEMATRWRLINSIGAFLPILSELTCPLEDSHRGNIWWARITQLSKDFCTILYDVKQLTSILMEECRGSPKRQTMRPDAFNRERCGGVEVLPPSSFYPVGWFEAQILYSHRTGEVFIWAESGNVGIFPLQKLRFSALCGPNLQKMCILLTWPKIISPKFFLSNLSTDQASSL